MRAISIQGRSARSRHVKTDRSLLKSDPRPRHHGVQRNKGSGLDLEPQGYSTARVPEGARHKDGNIWDPAVAGHYGFYCAAHVRIWGKTVPAGCGHLEGRAVEPAGEEGADVNHAVQAQEAVLDEGDALRSRRLLAHSVAHVVSNPGHAAHCSGAIFHQGTDPGQRVHAQQRPPSAGRRDDRHQSH